MLIELSSDEEALRSTTARFLDDQMPVEEIRRRRDDPLGYDPKYWTRGAELGWTSLLVSEERGGGTVSGSPLADLSLIAYEFGTHAAPGPLVPVNIVATALDTAGTEPQLEVLGALMSGEATAAWCLAEPPPNDRWGTVTVEITPDGDDVVITGEKRPVECTADVDYLLVTGITGGSLTQVLIPADSPGVTIVPMQTVDLTRRFAAVRFDGVRLPASDVLVGNVGGADDQVAKQVEIAIVVHNEESVGAMRRGFDITTEWAANRYSFGRPLSSYQEIKHRFADMLSWLEGSNAINDAACAAVDAGSSDAPDLVSAAKAFIGDYGLELLQDCVQLHGGIGLTFEHDLHLFLRRATVNRSLLGTPGEHHQLIASLLSSKEQT
jgi:alkylation response protein AidB-like acyl-CoA dehydrogenase